MTNLLHRLSSLALIHTGIITLLLSLMGLLVFNLYIFPAFMTDFEHLENILDVRFGFSAKEAYLYLKALGPAGRASYTGMLLADMVYPLVYGLLFISILGQLVKAAPKTDFPIQVLVLIPLDAVLADWVENICILMMLHHFPGQIYWLAFIASAAGIIKWIVVLFSLCIAASLGIYILYHIHLKKTAD